MRKWHLVLFSALCILCGSVRVAVVHAESSLVDTSTATATQEYLDLDLGELMELKVYSASQYVQKVTEVPASVTILTADEIKKYSYRTLADILQNVNGFYVTNDRSYSYLGVRGFNRPGDYFVTNVTLFSHELFLGTEVSTILYNLFDERYGHPGSEEHV